MSGIFDQVINYAPPSLLKGTVTYKGTWSAATNTPTLINPPDSTTNGFYYVVSAAGTQFSLSFNIGDWIISNGSAWEKVDNTDAVSSVFGRTGAVVGVSTDYSSVGITATAVGASSPSTGAFTTLSATTPLAVASGGTGVASSTGTTNVVLSGSPTITTPVIAQINDANGNETLKLASIASAVNEVTIENAATGNAVHISATGGDASVGLHLAGKGASGYVNVQDSTDATKRIMFNAAGGTTNTRTMLSSTQTVDRILSLPDVTDTLVGIAATQTLTNKTLTSPTITGGALNGTLGATTPSTIAATTISASGTTTVGPNNAGTGVGLLQLLGGSGSNGGATVNFGTNGTAYSSIGQISGIIGGTSTDFVIYANNGSQNIKFYAGGGGNVATITSTGLNSTAIGATTPSTVAATSVTASGIVQAGNYFNATAGDDGYRMNGTAILAGNANNLYIKGATNVNVQVPSGTTVTTFSSTGAAITGTLSCTTGANFATSSGSVGIGTASGSTKLTISGVVASAGARPTSGILFVTPNNANVQGQIGLVQSTTEGNHYLLLQSVEDSVAWRNVVLARDGGNVGIGTASPLDKLNVSGSSSGGVGGVISVGNVALPAVGNESVIGFRSASVFATTYYSGKIRSILTSASTYVSDLAFNTYDATGPDGKEVMRITSSGNVGIGTTSPAGVLNVHAASSDPVAWITRADNSSGISSTLRLGNNDATYKNSSPFVRGLTEGGINQYNLTFGTSNGADAVERLRIDYAGNVGIGTTSPSSKLSVGGNPPTSGAIAGVASSGGVALALSDNVNSSLYVACLSGGATIGTDSGGVLYLAANGVASGNRVLGIFSTGHAVINSGNATNGKLGINFAASGSLYGMSLCDSLNTSGALFVTFQKADGTTIGSIARVTTTDAVVYSTTSDYRRKSNVKDLTGSGTFIDALKPRTFDWDTGDKGVGFIAHEFAEVSPLSVTGEKDAVDADGKPIYQGMQASTAEVIANLVAELQSLRKRLAALESK